MKKGKKDTSPVKASMPVPMGLQQPVGWEDLNQDEKIERLREIVKNQMQTINNFHQTTEFLRDMIFKHIHGENGRILIDAPRYQNSSIGGFSSASNGVAISSNHKPFI